LNQAPVTVGTLQQKAKLLKPSSVQYGEVFFVVHLDFDININIFVLC